MIIYNPNSLIGDFLGTIPAMQAMNATYIISPVVKELASMAQIKFHTHDGFYDKMFDLHKTFTYAAANNLHMIQAFFWDMGLNVPSCIPKPKLHIVPEKTPKVAYVLSPFSRSLPEHERWQKEKWQALVESMPETSFALIGSWEDDHNFINAPNCIKIFGMRLNYVSNLLCNAKALISVVTGTSHLAYALGVKNYLFFNQGMWGKNPDAVLLNDPIPDIPVQKVIECVQSA